MWCWDLQRETRWGGRARQLGGKDRRTHVFFLILSGAQCVHNSMPVQYGYFLDHISFKHFEMAG